MRCGLWMGGCIAVILDFGNIIKQDITNNEMKYKYHSYKRSVAIPFLRGKEGDGYSKPWKSARYA